MAEDELKTIWKHSRIYGLGNVVNRAAGIILLPVYINVLAPEEFGLYALITIATELLAMVLGMGLGTALVRSYVDRRGDVERHRVVSTAIITYLFLALLFALLADPLAYATCILLFGSPQHQWLFTLAYWALIFTVLFETQLNYIRVRKKSLQYLLVSIGKAVLFLVLNLLFLLVLDLRVLGIVYGTLFSAAVISVALLASILSRTGFRFSIRILRELASYGLPLVPASFIDVAITSLDKYVLNLLVTTAAVGNYAVGDRLASLLRMFIAAPFTQIWVVRRLETLSQEEDDDEVTFSNIFHYFLIVITGAALTLAMFSPEIVALIASREYLDAALVVPLLACAQILATIEMNFEIGIHHARKTWFLALRSAITLVAAIPLFYFLIASFGLLGAATARLLVHLIRTSLVAWFAIPLSPVVRMFLWRPALSVLALGVLAYTISVLLFETTVSPLALVVKAGLLALFLGTLLITPAFVPERGTKPRRFASQMKWLRRLRAGRKGLG